jgi:simple sugar transport system permease protein
MDKKTRDIFITSFLAIISGLLLSGIMILFLGKNPIPIFGLLFSSMFRDGYTVGEIFVKATPLIFTALAFAFTFKANLFNIGAQGQFYIGSLVAVSISLLIPHPIAIPIAIVLSFIASGIWGGIIGFCKARFKANEFLISMMSTYVALNLMNYLLRTVLLETKGEYPQTDSISKSTWLLKIVPHTRLHFGFIIAIVVAIIIWLLLYRTTLGFRIRAVGQNQEAARMSGINPELIFILTFFISGGLAGLAGVTEVNGIQHMLLQGFNPTIGALGIGIAILANANPIGIIFASILFGALQVGGTIMGQLSGIPSSIIDLMEGFVMVFVIISYYVRNRWEINREKKLLKEGAK